MKKSQHFPLVQKKSMDNIIVHEYTVGQIIALTLALFYSEIHFRGHWDHVVTWWTSGSFQGSDQSKNTSVFL